MKKKILFQGVGRNKQSWSRSMSNPSDDDILREARRTGKLMNGDLDLVFDKQMDEAGKEHYSIFAGSKVVGSVVIEAEAA